MKKFIRFVRHKKDSSESGSKQGTIGSRQSSLASLGAISGGTAASGGYDVRDKDLGKIHKAICLQDLNKVKSLSKKESNLRDKENR